MLYEDEVMEYLEECLSMEDIERWGDRIDQVIDMEESSGNDKVVPHILAQEITNNIFNGVWDRELPEEFGLWRENSCDYDMNEQFC